MRVLLLLGGFSTLKKSSDFFMRKGLKSRLTKVCGERKTEREQLDNGKNKSSRKYIFVND